MYGAAAIWASFTAIPHQAVRCRLASERLKTRKTSESATHALISLMPSPSGAGRLLTIAGNGSPDTLAAAEWLTQPWRAREIIDRL